MSRLPVFAALSACLGLAACGPPPGPHYGGGPAPGPGGKPSWVDGRPTRYPDMQYLVGVGRGMGRGTCEDDAYAALAKIFNAKIKQESEDWQGHFSKVSNLGKVKIEAMSISQLTRVSTDKVLKGAITAVIAVAAVAMLLG